MCLRQKDTGNLLSNLKPKGCLREEEWRQNHGILRTGTCLAGYSPRSRLSFHTDIVLIQKIKREGRFYNTLLRALGSSSGFESWLCCSEPSCLGLDSVSLFEKWSADKIYDWSNKIISKIFSTTCHMFHHWNGFSYELTSSQFRWCSNTGWMTMGWSIVRSYQYCVICYSQSLVSPPWIWDPMTPIRTCDTYMGHWYGVSVS